MDMNNLLTILLLVASVTAFFFLLRSRGRGSEAERDLALMRGELEQQRERFQEREELLKKSGEELQNAFKALSAEALKSNREDFLALAQRELEKKQIEAKGELEKREQAVKSLVDPINKNLD